MNAPQRHESPELAAAALERPSQQLARARAADPRQRPTDTISTRPKQARYLTAATPGGKAGRDPYSTSRPVDRRRSGSSPGRRLVGAAPRIGRTESTPARRPVLTRST